jgi:hypothetical protein
VSAITFLGERLAEERPIVKEWNVGSPAAIPFDATWARPAVFVTALSTNLDAPQARRVVTGTGGQIDFRFGALSALQVTMSIGGAVAMERGQTPRREAMVSLKILR